MNLKESFRYQNRIDEWIEKTTEYLVYPQNIMKKTQEHMRKKANIDATDEIIDCTKDREIPYEVNRLVDFLVDLLAQKNNLSKSISEAKRSCVIDIDESVATNKKKQEISSALNSMAKVKASERIIRGNDYKFNVSGEQVQYAYEIKEVNTIDFDRNKVKGIAKKLMNESDEVSSKLDKAMIETIVNYEPQYDINDSYDDILEVFMNK